MQFLKLKISMKEDFLFFVSGFKHIIDTGKLFCGRKILKKM